MCAVRTEIFPFSNGIILQCYQESQAFLQIVENPLSELLKLIPPPNDELPALFIAIDEAGKLYQDAGTNSETRQGHPRKELKLAALRRILHGLHYHDLWSFFVSMDVRIGML